MATPASAAKRPFTLGAKAGKPKRIYSDRVHFAAGDWRSVDDRVRKRHVRKRHLYRGARVYFSYTDAHGHCFRTARNSLTAATSELRVGQGGAPPPAFSPAEGCNRDPSIWLNQPARRPVQFARSVPVHQLI